MDIFSFFIGFSVCLVLITLIFTVQDLTETVRIRHKIKKYLPLKEFPSSELFVLIYRDLCSRYNKLSIDLHNKEKERRLAQAIKALEDNNFEAICHINQLYA